MSEKKRRIESMQFDKGDVIYLEKKKHGQMFIAGYYKIIGFGNLSDFPGGETYKVVEVQRQPNDHFIKVGAEKFINRRDIEGRFRKYWGAEEADIANKLDEENLEKLNRVLQIVGDIYGEGFLEGYKFKDELYEAWDKLKDVIKDAKGGVLND